MLKKAPMAMGRRRKNESSGVGCGERFESGAGCVMDDSWGFGAMPTLKGLAVADTHRKASRKMPGRWALKNLLAGAAGASGPGVFAARGKAAHYPDFLPRSAKAGLRERNGVGLMCILATFKVFFESNCTNVLVGWHFVAINTVALPQRKPGHSR